jgi:Rrf2 family iron-sulfur cluster assembly transcriptional regulator
MLNQTSIYALRAMGFLARHKDNSPVLSSLIADEMKIPKNFLSKILNRLVQGGLVHALRGRNGGVSLARPAAQIKLYDIVNLFMKMDDFKRCFLGLNECDGNCGLHIRWQIIAEQYEKLMNETTVEQLI